ncbi:MAG: hypothetical protein CMH54_09765 [Myxococcales bacterium]|nr:hypothetical protein [Myxococcales bacterium]
MGRIGICFLGVLFFWCSVSLASVPQRLHYQGYLTDTAGNPINCNIIEGCSENYVFTFSLYDSMTGDGLVWSEAHSNISITNGVFHVELGGQETLDAEFLDGNRWLEIQVNLMPPMSPRQRVVSAPFALRADVAERALESDNAVTLGGQPVENFVQVGDSSGFLTEEGLQDVLDSLGYVAGDNDTLGGLNACGLDQILKWDGSAWVCAVNADTDTLSALLCAAGEIVQWDGTTWNCSAALEAIQANVDQVQANLNTLGSSLDPIATSGLPADLLDGDDNTLGELTCSDGEVARWNGSSWACSAADAEVEISNDPPACTAATIGTLHYNPGTDKLTFCDGNDYRNVRLCDDICPSPSDVACGQAVESDCGIDCGSLGSALNPVQCNPSTVACNDPVYDNCGNTCIEDGTALNPLQCANPALHACGTALADSCGNSCPSGTHCDVGTCSGGECTNLNTVGSIRVGSEYAGPAVAGYTQCAGFMNTGSWDILTNDWVHSCASDGSKKWLVRLYNPITDALLLEDTFPSFTATELNNNLPGCDIHGYGICGKSSTAGTGRALLVLKPDNQNGGCHGDDNSRGAFRISTNPDGNIMGNNFVFVGGQRSGGEYRDHDFGNSPDSEIRYLNGSEWDGCDHDGRVAHAITVYLEN